MVVGTAAFCGACGTRNVAGAPFCGNCGKDLRLEGSRRQTAVAIAPPAAPPQAGAANPKYGRPARYSIALVVVAAVIATLVLGSFLYLSTPFRGLRTQGASLLLVIFVAAGAGLSTYIMVRAFDHHDAARRKRDLTIGAVVFGGLLILWLLNIALYVNSVTVGSTLLCLPSVAFALWVIRRIDRNQKEPWRLVVAALVWGAIVATSLAIPINTVLGHAIDINLHGSTAAILNGFVPGVVEELAKGAAVVLLFLVMRNEFDDVVDGIVYGALVGLGFTFVETQNYMAQGHALAQVWIRLGPGLFFSHVAYTALVGAGLGIARQQRETRKQVISVLSGFALAIAAHFNWDALAFLNFIPATGINGVDLFVVIPIETLLINGPFVAALLLLLSLGLRREGRALRRELTTESRSGHGAILPEEVPILMSPNQRFAARLKALARGGAMAYIRTGNLQAAQLGLAMEEWHRERQEIDSPLSAEAELRTRIGKLRGSVVGAAV